MIAIADRPSPVAAQWYAGKDVPGVEYVPASGDGIPDRWYVRLASGIKAELRPGDWVVDYRDGTFGVRRASVAEL